MSAEAMPLAPVAAEASSVRVESARLVSLDAFRGFTIASMVLVNNPGDWGHLYRQLGHAKWNGFTFTDLVFPFFLFIGGVSMTLSLGRRAEAGADKPALLRQLAKRAAMIFAIGLLLHLVPKFDFANMRIPGVLQRIALCTLLAAPIVVYFDWRRQCLAIAVLLALYTGLELFVPVPGIGAGVLEPGRDFGAWVDRRVFGKHVWVQSKTWDPEGLVSTISALASQLFGVLAGRWLATDRSARRKTLGMLGAGALCLAVAFVIDATFMPINKSLWTTSYAIGMTGMALLFFAPFYWAIDGSPRLRSGARRALLPFTIYGMNALFIFAGSGLVAKLLGKTLRAHIHAPLKAFFTSPLDASLAFALCFDAIMFLVAWAMWKKKWFVKV